MGMFILLAVVNFALSWFNAWQAGKAWNEAKIQGGLFRLTVWSAAVMSACGFTWVYLFVATLAGLSAEKLTPEEARSVFELGYLIIIGPVLGSGLILTIHSWFVAIRERNLLSVGTAGWNTYAQARNVYGAATEIPGIFSRLGDSLFSSSSPSSSKGKGKGGVLIVLLVIAALCAGIITTVAIVSMTSRKYPRLVNN